MEARTLQRTLPFIALTIIVASVAPVQALTEGVTISQSPGVSASGMVYFYNAAGQVVGSELVSCTGGASTYNVIVSEKPVKIAWNINIDWGGGATETWKSGRPPGSPDAPVPQPWPATYTKTHSPTFVQLSPSSVGGTVISVDKFGLLAPYIGVASTIIAATVAAAIYVKRVKRREERQ